LDKHKLEINTFGLILMIAFIKKKTYMNIVGNRLMASSIEDVIENPEEQTVLFKLTF
jgi:hypothetical protein